MTLNAYLSIWASIASIATMSVAITALVIATDVLATINRPDVRFEGPKVEVPSIELRWPKAMLLRQTSRELSSSSYGRRSSPA